MGRKVITTYVDDMTGDEVADQEEISWIGVMIDGDLYQLEVTEDTVEKFRKSVNKYLQRAAELYDQGEQNKYREGAYDVQEGWLGWRPNPNGKPARNNNAIIRKWWNEEGGRGDEEPIPNRGRIPKHVVEAWEKESALRLSGVEES